MTDQTVMDIFEFIKKCLKEFNYPNIHALSDAGIANIFKPSNTSFLMSWIFKRLNSDTTSITGTELISEYGFCDENHKVAFIKGQLSIEQQLEIYYKMFKFLKDIENDKTHQVDLEPMLNDDVIELLNLDVNIFPDYGPVEISASIETDDEKLYTSSDLKELQKSLDDNIYSTNNNQSVLEKSLYNSDFMNTLHNGFNNCDQILASFVELSSTVKRHRNPSNKPNNNIKLNPNTGPLLKQCNEQVKSVLQYKNNCNVIRSFLNNIINNNTDNCEDLEEEKFYATFPEITKLITEACQQKLI